MSSSRKAFVLFLPLLIFCVITRSNGEEQKKRVLPLISKLYSADRSEKEDLVFMQNGDVLKGTVLTNNLSISTAYGKVTIPVRRSAGITFLDAKSKTGAVVSVNYNKISGVIENDSIEFTDGNSNETLDISREKIKFVLFKKVASEAIFVDLDRKADLFVMNNGDLLVGKPSAEEMKILTDNGTVSVSFEDIRIVEIQSGEKVIAKLTKKNGDVVLGAMATEDLSLLLDVGGSIDKISTDKFTKIFVGDGMDKVVSLFDVQSPVQSLPKKDASSDKFFTNSIGMKFVKIPVGSFLMGSPKGEQERGKDEGPQRTVKMTKSFFMGIYEVMQCEYKKVIGKNPSKNKSSANLPVEQVSWFKAVAFCKKLSQRDPDYTYLLPTEAQWEYCCRAGSTTAFYWGEEWDDDYGWNDVNSGGSTHEVGGKKPNAWGLYDMSGNVWEWCSDWYGKKYLTKDNADPVGPAKGNKRGRVKRGGGWYCSTQGCRSANRYYNKPKGICTSLGFRVIAICKVK